MAPMGIAIDHVFIWTSDGAPEAEHLAHAFKEGPPNVHPGQGTANRRFFFDDFMLELLWVSDPAEAQSEQTCRTGLYDRWIESDRGGCPFGFIFRPDSNVPEPPPFPAWEYRPSWLPPPHVVYVAETPFHEPIWFYMDFLRPSRNNDQFVNHRNLMGGITGVELTTPRPMASESSRAVLKSGALNHRTGPQYQLDITFDNNRRNQLIDITPDLPVRFHA
jgi:hypothetical protein